MKRNHEDGDDLTEAAPKRRKITPTLVSVPVLFPSGSSDNSNGSSFGSDSYYDSEADSDEYEDSDDSDSSYYQLHMNPRIILDSKSQSHPKNVNWKYDNIDEPNLFTVTKQHDSLLNEKNNDNKNEKSDINNMEYDKDILLKHFCNEINEIANLVLSKKFDSLLIVTGAGMGCDSGLPDYRSQNGFWKDYPPFRKVLTFMDPKYRNNNNSNNNNNNDKSKSLSKSKSISKSPKRLQKNENNTNHTNISNNNDNNAVIDNDINNNNNANNTNNGDCNNNNNNNNNNNDSKLDESLTLHEMSKSEWFLNDPLFAWGFYSHRTKLYKEATPHSGFNILLNFTKNYFNNNNYFYVTSNIDDQVYKAQFIDGKIWQTHGSLGYIQCVKNCNKSKIIKFDKIIPINPRNFRVKNRKDIPRCSGCSRMMRPNVSFFSDNADSFNDERSYEQKKKCLKFISQFVPKNWEISYAAVKRYTNNDEEIISNENNKQNGTNKTNESNSNNKNNNSCSNINNNSNGKDVGFEDIHIIATFSPKSMKKKKITYPNGTNKNGNSNTNINDIFKDSPKNHKDSSVSNSNNKNNVNGYNTRSKTKNKNTSQKSPSPTKSASKSKSTSKSKSRSVSGSRNGTLKKNNNVSNNNNNNNNKSSNGSRICTKRRTSNRKFLNKLSENTNQKRKKEKEKEKQNENYKNENESSMRKQLLLFEIGCGTSLHSLRWEVEYLKIFENITIIRINPCKNAWYIDDKDILGYPMIVNGENANNNNNNNNINETIQKKSRHIGLRLKAQDALVAIQEQIDKLNKLSHSIQK